MKTRHERIKEMIEEIKEVAEEPLVRTPDYPGNQRVYLAKHLLQILDGKDDT